MDNKTSELIAMNVGGCSTREDYIDLFRGVGIILMVMGHIGYGGGKDFGASFDKWIHAFHMPMFFLIAGLFFKANHTTNVWKFVKKKAKSLLLPYLFFGTIHYLLWFCMAIRHAGVDYLYPIRQLLFVNNYDLPIEGALWFLTAMFLAELFYFFTLKCSQGKETITSIIVLVIVLLGHCVRVFSAFRLPWSMDAAFISVGLIHVGKTIKRKNVIQWVLNVPLIISTLFAIILCLSIFINGPINMNGAQYSFVPLFWINAVGSTLCGLNLSKKYCAMFGNSVIARLITDIGRNSIVFLCCNHLTILVMGRGLRLLGINSPWIVTVATIVFLWAFSKFIEGKKVALIFGK